MTTILMAILSIIITVSLIIGVHEFGHFCAAKWFGIKVLRFSIGFGRPLKLWKDKSGVEYVVAMIPFGGYVKLLDEREEKVNENEKHLTFNRQSVFKRLIVIMMGPCFNFLFAFLSYWFIFMIGMTTLLPVIGQVVPNSIASRAGLKTQQQIVQIDGRKVLDWTDVSIAVFRRIGDQGQMTVKTSLRTNKKTSTYFLNLYHWKLNDLQPNPLASLGVMPLSFSDIKGPDSVVKTYQYLPIPALKYAFLETEQFIYFNALVLKKLILGDVSIRSLAGPLSIFSYASEAFEQGIVVFLNFLAFLSLSIGFINLLPIPGLDGGQILYLMIEKIIGRPISIKTQVLVYRLSMIIVFFIIFQAVINDILRLF